MTKAERIQELIEYATTHLCDIIPYNTPDYEEVLLKEAKHFAETMYEWETNPSERKNINDYEPLLDDDLPF